jgi:hypothetical protein
LSAPGPERQPPKSNEKISDLFSDEEKKQLSYLGSMLHQEPTQEEEEQQRALDWFLDQGIKKAQARASEGLAGCAMSHSWTSSFQLCSLARGLETTLSTESPEWLLAMQLQAFLSGLSRPLANRSFPVQYFAGE